MSFMAITPTSSQQPEAVEVENDGWFPPIHLHHMRDAMRLDGTVTDARLTQAVVDAILHVNEELKAWKHIHITAGHPALADVPASQVNRESKLVIHYRRAVYSTAKADLLEKYRDYDSTASSMADKKSMEYLDNAPAEQRRNAHWAISNLLGLPHLTVELI